MARLLLNSSTQTQETSLTSQSTVKSRSASSIIHLSEAALGARLRQPRSIEYLEALTQIDSGGHIHDSQAVDKLVTLLHQEFPDIAIEDFPLGIVAQCYLGAPFEVHTFDFAAALQISNVIRHYKTFETMPDLMEKARSLALNPAYAFVEVYTNKIIPVAFNRSVSILASSSANGCGVAPF